MKTAPQTFRIQIFCPNCVESPFWVFFKRSYATATHVSNVENSEALSISPEILIEFNFLLLIKTQKIERGKSSLHLMTRPKKRTPSRF